MTNKKNRFVASVLVAGMFVSSAAFASAETATSSPDIAALTAQVQNLLAQVAALQAQLDATKKEVIAVKQELILTRALAFGSKGSDVSDLQEFLKDFPDIYPEGLVTGFFGHATEKAIKRFQEKHGFETVGIVGPKTREKIKELFSEHKGKGKGLFIKHDDDDDEDEDDDDDTFASTTPGAAKVVVCHKEGKKHGGETIKIGAPALPAHLAHGDTLGACGGGTATTTPDITAPIISNIVSSPLTTTAGIVWDTNESAAYKFWYGTTTPVVLGTPNMTGGLNTHQVIGLSGLTPDTTYHFVIGATDASGNTSTSTEQSFKTTLDTTAPVISGLTASGITASSANLLWSTNESADSTVWYSLVNPVDMASTTITSVVTNAASVTSHSLSLSGLTASTTYFYLVGSKDTAGNQATSSQSSFMTL